jgi:hypothetical protein
MRQEPVRLASHAWRSVRGSGFLERPSLSGKTDGVGHVALRVSAGTAAFAERLFCLQVAELLTVLDQISITYICHLIRSALSLPNVNCAQHIDSGPLC